MSTFTQSITTGVNPPYTGVAYRSLSFPNEESWATIRSSNANGGLVEFCQLITQREALDTVIYALYRCSFGFDLTSLTAGFTASAASINIKSGTHEDILAPYWSDTNRGVVLVTLDESIKTANTFEAVDYQAMFGSFVEISNVIPFTSLAADGGWNSIPLNATGIAYLNSVRAKANYPGYAYIGMAFPGDVRNVGPTSGPTVQSQKDVFHGQAGASAPYLEMTYDSSTLVNIGDDWKSVDEIQVNIGDAWKAIKVIQPNIGDVWKDLV